MDSENKVRCLAWERARKIAAIRGVSPVKVNWEFCLFMAAVRFGINMYIAQTKR